MTFGEKDSGITGDRHGRQFFLFVRRFGIIHKIKAFQFFGNPFLQIEQAELVYFAV